MIKLYINVLSAALTAFLCLPTLAAQDLPKPIAGANMELDSRFGEAMNNKDIEGVMACFADSPDLVVVLYGTVLRGPAALRQYMIGMFAFPGTIHGEITSISYWRSGDMVFAVGTAVITFTPLSGSPFAITEVWTDARRKVGSQWVYILDHATQIP